MVATDAKGEVIADWVATKGVRFNGGVKTNGLAWEN